MNNSSTTELFDQGYEFPDVDAKERLSALVGLDEHKTRLTKILSLLINPKGLEEWTAKHHSGSTALMQMVLRRPPLVVLAGDVGSGKTELAETIGDAVARQERLDVSLLSLSLSSRGRGRVGEMTQLLASAFEHTLSEATKLKSTNGKARGGLIMLVDEADAIAQSREGAQMHHEDRAGVNAFIRGIDKIANARVPVAVIMCTNRLGSLDPAVKRRAADILEFFRPNAEQRRAVLSPLLKSVEFKDEDVDHMIDATGKIKGREYGFTFSDLTQRLMPTVVLDAYPNEAIRPDRAIELTRNMRPTPPFKDTMS